MKHSMMDEERYTSNTHFYDQSAGKAQTTEFQMKDFCLVLSLGIVSL